MDKIKVYAKSQNRTVLGIVKAYSIIYPKAVLKDFRRDFPNSLNPDKGVDENFIYAEEKGTTANWEGFFKKEDEIIKTRDGKDISLVSMWTKPSYERAIKHAKKFGIIVAPMTNDIKLGSAGYKLEYINGFAPVASKRGIAWWIWALITLIIAIIIALFVTMCNKKDIPQTIDEPKTVEKVVEKVVEKIVVVRDTVYVQKIAELQKEFNATQFSKNSTELTESAKAVLLDIKKELDENQDINLCIIGHSSEEGDATYNKNLSEARAKAAVDFLVSKGVSSDRLKYEGKGSSEPLEAGNHEKNRRTEFKVEKR